MSNSPLTFRVARPEDAETWFKLYYEVRNWPLPDDITDEVEQFQSAPPEIASSRFISWLGNEPIAGYILHPLDNVIELKSFWVLSTYLATYGPVVLKHVVALARERSAVLTVDGYPESYSEMFLNAGFKQNTRTKMLMSLDNYQVQPVKLSAGVSLRHPVLEDEQALAELAYTNYRGTVDEDMVCSSRAQAVTMMRAIFGSEYCLFDLESSFLAEDEQQRLVGNVLLGDISQDEEEGLMWVLDISVGAEWRGKGLGKALFVSGLNAAKAKGYTQVGLFVTVGNDNALALYRSYGFKEVGGLLYEAVLHPASSSASQGA